MKIPKNIHISWKDKSLLESNSIFVKNCIGKLVELAEGWTPYVYDDNDIEIYLKNNLSLKDYKLLENRHIVEKCDIWRLIKLYNEGGLYCDIDRLCNTSINDVVKPNDMMVLPEYNCSDFSQDFMCSAPNNPIFLETIKLNLERRAMGHKNIYFLGPQTYFHGVTKALTGNIIDVNPGAEVFQSLRNLILQSDFITTYIEKPPHDTIIYRPENGKVNFDHETEKRKFYSEMNIRHWTDGW